jgi:cytochrome bd-type quinol oxidase subunit 1
MNYPQWDVPVLGGGLVIATIAILHVFISHFAVGGGFYLAITEGRAVRAGRQDWLEVLKAHSWFFLVLTGVFGTVSGVGIWFSIGLANPTATSALIHYFVFVWAMEWVVFLVELCSIAVYCHLWGRVSNKLHLRIGWLYAVTAWLSLFLINGILGFMLTPGSTWLGQAGSGREPMVLWSAFFNPTTWPSLFLRTLICLSLAGVFALVTASRIDGERQPRLKTEMIRWAARWLIPSFVLLPLGVAWYLAMVPEPQRHLLQLGISTIGTGAFSLVTRMALVSFIASAALVAVVALWAWRNAISFRLLGALGVAFLALVAIGSTEHVREMLRKPFVIGEYLYSNGVRKMDVAAINQRGYLAGSLWIWPVSRVVKGRSADYQVNLQSGSSDGEMMFRGQCMACHTVDGYRSMRQLLRGRNRESLGSLLKILHEDKPDSPYHAFMPPLVGTDVEISALGDYLLMLEGGVPSAK